SGALAAEVWGEYQKKLAVWSSEDARRRFADLQADWELVAGQLRRLVRPAAVVREILARAGAPLRFEDLDPPIPPDQYRFALLNPHYLRARFAVSDLFFWLGRWDEETVDRLLARSLG